MRNQLLPGLEMMKTNVSGMLADGRERSSLCDM